MRYTLYKSGEILMESNHRAEILKKVMEELDKGTEARTLRFEEKPKILPPARTEGGLWF